LDDEISFSETEERFISKAEVDYSNLLAARKAVQAIEDEKSRIKLLQKREQRNRFINHMLKEFQIEALDQFPEVKTQKLILRQNKNYLRLFHDNKSVYPNEDYLLIELAVYVKFYSDPGQDQNLIWMILSCISIVGDCGMKLGFSLLMHG
jgi:hypothetical protein